MAMVGKGYFARVFYRFECVDDRKKRFAHGNVEILLRLNAIPVFPSMIHYNIEDDPHTTSASYSIEYIVQENIFYDVFLDVKLYQFLSLTGLNHHTGGRFVLNG